MDVKAIMAELESLGDEKRRAYNSKHGAGENQFGVKLGDVRAIAKKVKKNHELALELWETGHAEARRVAILIMKPKELSVDEIDKMVRSVTWVDELDWFTNYVINKHPDADALRERWMTDDHPMAARAGWALTAERVVADPEESEFSSLLDRIESEMGVAEPEVQWTMNTCLVQIGINQADQRKRALSIGETLGLYAELKAPKGCTSPYAPEWINEMVSRQS